MIIIITYTKGIEKSCLGGKGDLLGIVQEIEILPC